MFDDAEGYSTFTLFPHLLRVALWTSSLPLAALCILLVVGKILRVTIRLFQKLYLPASVIGGLLGLALVQTNRWLPTRSDDGGLDSAARIPHQHRLFGPLPGSLHSTDQTHLGESPGRSWRTVKSWPGASTLLALGWRSCF